jgi:ubiquitin C-terminal hydrolase
MTRKLNPKCKILIVHINRFSLCDGEAYKELSTQRILRKFLNYELVGMICHSGKKVTWGHYMYYHKLTDKRWAHFNDRVVEEF